MSIQIGRVTLNLDRHGKLEEPTTITQAGELLQMAGTFKPSATATARQFRQNMLGHAEVQESIPVVASPRLDISGFYRVTSSSVSTLPLTQTSGEHSWSVSLLREPVGYANASFETLYQVGLRPNSEGVSLPVRGARVVAYPYIAADTIGYVQASGDALVTTATGVIQRQYTTLDLLGVTQFAANTTGIVHTTPPVGHYQGAATIEVKDSDDVWWPVAGRQIVDAKQVRIGNGLLRVTIDATTPPSGRIMVDRWTGSAWSDQMEVRVAYGANRLYPAAPTTKIARNSPEHCSITVQGDQGGGKPSALTIGLSRGQYMAEFAGLDAEAVVTLHNAAGTLLNTQQADALYGDSRRSTTAIGNSGTRYGVIAANDCEINGQGLDVGVSATYATNFAIGISASGTALVTEVLAPYYGAQASTMRVVS